MSAGRAVSPEIQNCSLLCLGPIRALQAFNSLQRHTVLQRNRTQTRVPALQSVNSLVPVERALQQQIWVTRPTKDKRLQMTRACVLSVAEEETKISF